MRTCGSDLSRARRVGRERATARETAAARCETRAGDMRAELGARGRSPSGEERAPPTAEYGRAMA